MSKVVYIINTQSTGVNGNIICSTDSAYTSERKALEVCDNMNKELIAYDVNFLAYVTGPIILSDD